MKQSPEAADRLIELIEDGDISAADDAMGETDCPHGCVVEPDGTCEHGYWSAGKTAGMI